VSGTTAGCITACPNGQRAFGWLATDVIVIRPRVGAKSLGGLGQGGASDCVTYTTQQHPKPHSMTTSTLRDKLAALEAERDLLPAQLAKAHHNKKPYQEMTTEE
jgi:hypothetical protein